MPEIIVRINKQDHGITIEGKGYRGKQCVKDTTELMQELKATDAYAPRSKPEMVVDVGVQKIHRG